MCAFLYLLESNKQWIQAYEICRNKGMTLAPINSIWLSNGIYSSTKTMWTPNYVLDLDYFGKTGNLLNVMFLVFSICKKHGAMCFLCVKSMAQSVFYM
jgi:hypothetical protein